MPFAGNYRLPPIETQRMLLQDKKNSSASGACNLQFSLDTIVEIGSPIYLQDQENKVSSLNKASKKISKSFAVCQESPKKTATRRHNKARNPWTPKEDHKLSELMKKYGQSWAMISSLMDGRTGKQVRDRYLNKLRPNIRCGDWSQREDEILVSMCKEVGNRWSLIATHLPGRTEAQVKNRFYSCIKKRLTNNGNSIESSTNPSSPFDDNGFVSEAPAKYFNEDDSEYATTQLPSPQSGSESSYEPVNTISYEEDNLYFNQMQRCGSFVLPTIENENQVDDAITKVATYFAENSHNHNFHSEIDSFFGENSFAPREEVKDVRLDALSKRKAYLEMALANTLQEINTL